MFWDVKYSFLCAWWQLHQLNFGYLLNKRTFEYHSMECKVHISYKLGLRTIFQLVNFNVKIYTKLFIRKNIGEPLRTQRPIHISTETAKRMCKTKLHAANRCRISSPKPGSEPKAYQGWNGVINMFSYERTKLLSLSFYYITSASQ